MEIRSDLLALETNNPPASEGLMLRCTFYQVSLLGVDPDEIRLEKTSFERALPDLMPRLVSLDDKGLPSGDDGRRDVLSARSHGDASPTVQVQPHG